MCVDPMVALRSDEGSVQVVDNTKPYWHLTNCERRTVHSEGILPGETARYLTPVPRSEPEVLVLYQKRE